MMSFIISIISILLVAILALVSVLYVSDALNKGSSMARATESINQGTQILAAMDLFKVDHGRYPDDVQELVDFNYLKEVPSLKLAQSPYLYTQAVALAQEKRQWVIPKAGVPLAWTEAVSQQDFKEICKSVNYKTRRYDGILKRIQATPETQCFGPDLNDLRIVVSRTEEAIEEVTAKDPDIYDDRKTPPEETASDWLVPPLRIIRNAPPKTAPDSNPPPNPLEGHLVLNPSGISFGKTSNLPTQKYAWIAAREGYAYYGSISISGVGYSLGTGGTCILNEGPQRLEKYQSCSIQILLNAPSSGVYNGQLQVVSGSDTLTANIGAEKLAPSTRAISKSHTGALNFDYGTTTTNLVGYKGSTSQTSTGVQLFVRNSPATTYLVSLLDNSTENNWGFSFKGACSNSSCNNVGTANASSIEITTTSSSPIPTFGLKPPTVTTPGGHTFVNRVKIQSLDGSFEEIIEVYHRYDFNILLDGFHIAPNQDGELFPPYNHVWYNQNGPVDLQFLPKLRNGQTFNMTSETGISMGLNVYRPVYAIVSKTLRGALHGKLEISGPDKNFFKITRVAIDSSNGSGRSSTRGAAYNADSVYFTDPLPSSVTYPSNAIGFILQFSPLEPREHNAVLKFKSEGLPTGDAEINLRGFGINTVPSQITWNPAPGSYFNNNKVPPSTSSIEMRELRNGYNTIVVENIQYNLEGDDASFFEVTNRCPSIGPLSSCQVRVNFKGSTESRQFNARLVVRASNAPNFVFEYPIQIQVQAPTAQRSPDNASFDFGVSTPNSVPLEHVVYFENKGAAGMGLSFRVLNDPTNRVAIKSVRYSTSATAPSFSSCSGVTISVDKKSTTDCVLPNSTTLKYIALTYTVDRNTAGSVNAQIQAIPRAGTVIAAGDSVFNVNAVFADVPVASFRSAVPSINVGTLTRSGTPVVRSFSFYNEGSISNQLLDKSPFRYSYLAGNGKGNLSLKFRVLDSFNNVKINRVETMVGDSTYACSTPVTLSSDKKEATFCTAGNSSRGIRVVLDISRSVSGPISATIEVIPNTGVQLAGPSILTITGQVN